jgi:hypothetical protein
MNLEELIKLLGVQDQDRNGITRPGVYTPRDTKFQSYTEEDQGGGYVRPFSSPKTANFNANNDDMTNLLYTIFHESAHTAQKPQQDFINKYVGGINDPLHGNTFKEYDPTIEKPPSQEALATLRGMEAMMPSGKTVWDLKKLSNDYRADDVAERYAQETMKNNPGMTYEGAKRLVDVKMFPEHSLMHEPTDFIPDKKKRNIANIMSRLKTWMK